MPFSIQAQMMAMMDAMVWLVMITSAFTFLALIICLVGLIVEGLNETVRRSRQTSSASRPAAEHIGLNRAIAKPQL